ncbi:MAG: type I restriction-modification system subunit M N-terminal domain-containing protein [Rhodocyclaceae bacterium]|nr:type I restriction-modification system subunit M N-terminal domain-containing protein [Rhodocyclaceae bacterium]
MNTNTIVQKLWNYCNVLRDDGMSYGDYVEQLTYLLFLKMADERLGQPRFTWGQRSLTNGSLVDASETRQQYIAALQAADHRDIGPLLAFARS